MMDHETDGDGAINLSTSQRPSAATTPNGSVEYDEQDQVSVVPRYWALLALILKRLMDTAEVDGRSLIVCAIYLMY
jgi:hypothetical protein